MHACMHILRYLCVCVFVITLSIRKTRVQFVYGAFQWRQIKNYGEKGIEKENKYTNTNTNIGELKKKEKKKSTMYTNGGERVCVKTRQTGKQNVVFG